MISTECRPTLGQVIEAIAEAQLYYEAQDVEIFLFGAIADDEGTIFADVALAA